MFLSEMPSFAQLSSCANADFEQGSFANWTGTTGICCPINSITPGIVPGRHTIMTGPGTDPNTNGALTVVAPGGLFSARLGNDQVGAEAEQLSYQIQVDPGNALFIYRYAVVLEDPSHTVAEQPRFEIKVYDANGLPVGCGTYNVVASAGIPGFVTITNQFGSTIHYKDWTTVGIDLSPYIGQTVTIEFSTGDCALGGHFGYAYVDCYCSPLRILSDFCNGFSATILTAPVGFTAYLWSTGETTQSITIQNAVVGSQYQCTMTSVTGCTMTLTAVLTPTVIASSFGEGLACQNAAQFYDSSVVVTGTPITVWDWDFGDGTHAASQNPVHNFTTPGTYDVTLTVTNMGGCKDTITQSITIDPPPLSAFSETAVCPGAQTLFTDNSSSLNGPIVHWNWDFGDGSPADTLANPAHIYQLPGTYAVTLSVVDSVGCRDTVVTNINTLPGPVAGFSYLSACVSSLISFADTSLLSGTSVASWEWNFGDGSAVVTGISNPAHNFPASGSYTTSLIVTTTNGCVDTITGPVDVQSVPQAAFSVTQPCAGQYTQFASQSTTAVGSVAGWNWSFGDGSTLNGVENPSHVYTASGTYNVQLIVTGSNGCTDTADGQAVVLAAPLADFNFSSVCPGVSAVFSDNSTFSGGALTAWNWDFGDASAGVGGSPASHAFAAAGTYTVTMVVTASNGCVDTVQKPVPTDPVPQTAFFIPSGCENTAILFPNLSSISSGSISNYIWDFGDGSRDTLQASPSHVFTAPGTYFVQLTAASDRGCLSSVTNEVVVLPAPAAAFTVPSVCPGDTSRFNDNSQPGSASLIDWIWNFGDGSPEEFGITQPVHLYSGTGNYPVSLVVVNSAGCMDTVTAPAGVMELPVAAFGTLTPQCEGNGVATTNLSTLAGGTIVSSFWTYGSGNTSTSADPVLVFAQAGVFPVTLVVTGSNSCVDSVTRSLVIHANPHPSVTAANACVNMPVQLSGIAGTALPIIAWYWQAGNGTTGNQQVFNPAYAVAGIYNPFLQVTDSNGCKGDTTATIRIYPPPVADLSVANACPGETVVFHDLSTIPAGDTISQWSWNFGDGSPLDVVQNPSHLYGTSAVYPVTLMVTSQKGCRDTAYGSVAIHPLPVVIFSSDTVCEGLATSFSNSSSISAGNIVAWNWSFGDNTNGNAFEPVHVYPDGGTYTVQLSAVSDRGCADSATLPARVWYAPQPVFDAPDTAGCEDFFVSFNNQSWSQDGVIDVWHWDFGNGDEDNAQQTAYTYTDPGTYDVTLTVTSSKGCSADTIRNGYISVYALPVANFRYDPERPGVYMPTVYFYDQSTGADHWWWNFGDSSLSVIQNPEHFYPVAGSYTVALIVESPEGCRDTTWKVLEVTDDYAIWIPNGFTPNNDGKNDAFMVKGFGFTDFTMSIFNRWGDHIFSAADEAKGWDGTYNGADAPSDVYVYQVSIKDVFGNPHTYNGRVTLVR